MRILGLVVVVGGFLALLAGGIVLAVVLVSRGHRADRGRVDGLGSWATARGYAFHPDGSGLERRFSGTPFGRGVHRRTSQVVEGRLRERPFVAFDYRYTTRGSGSDDSDTVHRFSVVSMHLGAAVPTLQIRPQSAFGRFFTDSFGGDYRIGHPPFDDAFHVQTGSPEFTTDVLTPQVCDLLLATRGRAWRFQGDSLLVFRSGSHTAAEVEEVLAQMAHLLELVPPTVWARLRGDVGPTDAPV